MIWSCLFRRQNPYKNNSQQHKHIFSEVRNDMDTFMGSSDFLSWRPYYYKNNPESSGLFLVCIFYFFILFSPPICEFDESAREILSEWWEIVSRVGCIFEQHSCCHELCETIGEDLGIGFSYITTDLGVCRSSMVYCLQYEEYPLFPEEGVESLGMRTRTLRRTDHNIWVYIRVNIINFFLKAKNTLNLHRGSIDWCTWKSIM